LKDYIIQCIIRDTIEICKRWKSINEIFAECSILFKFKEGENFNHRNILDISRIKIRAWRRNWAKGGVMQRSQL